MTTTKKELIHARAEQHQPIPREALVKTTSRPNPRLPERLVSALKPGGWLVVEDYDPIVIDRAFPIENDEHAATVLKSLRALWSLMESRGLDMRWGSSLYRRFVAAGLVGVGMQGHIDMRSGGSPGARLDRANLSQVRDEALRKGLVTSEEMDRTLSLLDDPAFVFASPVMFSAWGQRPQVAA